MISENEQQAEALQVIQEFNRAFAARALSHSLNQSGDQRSGP
jgi:hypothetical protein